MDVRELPLDTLVPAPWNANEMDSAMRARLRRSLERFGVVVPLAVREMADGKFEILGGNRRLLVLKEMRVGAVPCVVVDVDDAGARLLAQALNRIAGEDNPGLRARLLRDVLEARPQREVLDLLPETAESLQGLSALGQQSLAEHLKSWESERRGRLHLAQFRLNDEQRDLVDQAIERTMGTVEHGAPVALRKGAALFELARAYLRQGGSAQ